MKGFIMAGNDSPVKMPELNLIPEAERGIKLDEGMKQVMSLLTAYWREKRVTLKASEGGILYVTQPQVSDIIHVTGIATLFTYQGDDVACSEVMVMSHPDNVLSLWVRPHKIAAANNAWPLDPKEVINLGITNLSMLNLLFGNETDIAIIAYTI